MSLRKTQLKKMTIEEISAHLASQTDPDNIKTISNFVAERNAGLQEKQAALMDELKSIRIKVEKSVKDLNGRVKDRIEKRQTIILDKDSRPSASTMTDLMALFAYLQNQGNIISRNNYAIKELAEKTQQVQTQLQRKAQRSLEYDELDEKYEKLNAQCRKEEAIRDSLLRERDQKRAHYANIESSIEAYRKQYEKVQSAIGVKERELIQLSGYYDARTNEDKSMLQELPVKSLQYETELLAAQEQLNACRVLLDQRKMMQIEAGLS